ncbi:MAG: hypothetical protein SA339_12175 [Methanomassiliicoccus sp.]|nr:hypothetical protein [Methanomassiliicoccus sp.]
MVEVKTDGLAGILGEAYVADIILFLDEHGKVPGSRIKNDLYSNYRKIVDIAEVLEGMRIIEIEFTQAPRRTFEYELTEKGKRLAKAIRAAVAIAKE